MAALDAAIHEKDFIFNMLLDGRVKPGHDNGRSPILFTASCAGMTLIGPASVGAGIAKALIWTIENVCPNFWKTNTRRSGSMPGLSL